VGRQYALRKKQSRFYREASFYSVGELEALLTMAGFSGFTYRQALIPEKEARPMGQEDHGSGSFVVMRALKPEGGTPR
jgi:hypothetical protein